MLHDISQLSKGRYRARMARSDCDIAESQKLRALAFGLASSDRDDFDAICTQVVIHDTDSGRMVCCFRLLTLDSGAQLDRSYSAQFYDLSTLANFADRMVELGRFCVHPHHSDPDILRVAWAALTRYVDENNIQMLFGCASFSGVDTALYLDAFALLRARYLAPQHWQPQIKAPDVFRFGALVQHQPDAKKAMLCLPTLLRSYLMMGGWVSDHAVIDHDLNTLHVFTGVEINAIPAARKRLLRAVVGAAF
ncbi:MAG: putative hemolysin [Paracoccaceae bacterium]|jgi:putative hemolysin